LVDNQTLEDAEETLIITLTDASATVNGTTQDIKIGTATATTINIKNDKLEIKWQTIAGTGANKATLSADSNSGGQRVFPEKSTPNGVIENKFELVFELEVAATANTTLYFNIFDADNFIGLGNNDNNATTWVGNDNYASLSTTTGSVTIAMGTISVTLTIIVYPDNYTGTKLTGDATTIVIDSAHAGDNFIVVADTDQANINAAALGTTENTRYKETHNYTQTDLLTVWRTLNVELDVANWVGMPDGETKVPLDGLVADELARACIVTKEYEDNNTPAPEVGDSGASYDDIDAITDVSIANNGRDIPVTDSEFWTVRIVTIPYLNTSPLPSTTAGFYASGYNTICICYETAYNIVSNWNETNDYVNYSDTIARTVLHEICHGLIDDFEQRVVFDSAGIPHSGTEETPWQLNGPVVDVSTIGVRSSIRRQVNNTTGTEPDIGRRSEYSHLLTTDIAGIQMYSRVNG
jgi:hypothetical protein